MSVVGAFYSVKNTILESPITILIVGHILLLSCVAGFYRSIIKPLSAFRIFVLKDIIALLTYPYAYLIVGVPGIIQLAFEVVMLSILLRRAEKIFSGVKLLALYVVSNIVGGFFACCIVFFIKPNGFRIFSTYIGNYAAITAITMLLALYRPKSEQWNFIIFPWGISIPYKSKNLNVVFINLGIATGFSYYCMLPSNYVCFPSIFFTYLAALFAYRLFFSGIVYGEFQQNVNL